MRQVDAELFLALLDVPRNDPWICERIRALREEYPDLCHILTLKPEEIKKMWDLNASQAAACGTCMHYLFEAHINGYTVPRFSPEFTMLQNFLQGMTGWRAYRTEWVIYAEEENLAGSVDFCAIDERGTLALIDWKRSANLETKYSSPRAMREPLCHLPDCSGWHYRLQLNAYRYIIEKYYGFMVSKMFIVGAHPDRQLEPFVDDVPRMHQETEAVMHIWRMKANDVRGAASSDSEQVQFTVCSAVNAEPLLICTLTILEARAESLLHIVRKAVSSRCGVPRLGVEILTGTVFLDDMMSWEECGSPDTVFVVKKPFSLACTEELFTAIEQKQSTKIYDILQAGQDPNCILRDSALTHAVIHSNACAVQILLHSGAVADVIPAGQRHAAIHTAANLESPACLEVLLQARADPNLPDLAGMLPIHHAMVVETAAQVQAVELLIEWGADVLQRDCDGDCAFSLAPSGRCVAACMDHCWNQLTMLDVMLRQLEGLVALTPCAPLWCTCKALSKQRVFFQPKTDKMSDAEGGSPSDSADLNRRIDQVEGLCRDYVILLTNLPDFWFQIPSPFLNIPDADWTSGLLLARNELQTAIAANGIRGADLVDSSRACKRIDAYATHLRQVCERNL